MNPFSSVGLYQTKLMKVHAEEDESDALYEENDGLENKFY